LYYHVHLKKWQLFSVGGAEAQILRNKVKYRYGHMTPISIIIMCRQDRDILFLVTCRRGSYEHKMIFLVLTGSTIWPEVVSEHGPNDDLTLKLMSLQLRFQ
jgi:hypothetical protein